MRVPSSMARLLCAVALSLGFTACDNEPVAQELFDEHINSVGQPLMSECDQKSTAFHKNCDDFGGTYANCDAANGTITCTCHGGPAAGTYSTKCSGTLAFPDGVYW